MRQSALIGSGVYASTESVAPNDMKFRQIQEATAFSILSVPVVLRLLTIGEPQRLRLAAHQRLHRLNPTTPEEIGQNGETH